jgi:hypothetical protein
MYESVSLTRLLGFGDHLVKKEGTIMTAIQKSSRTLITAAFAVFTLAVASNATEVSPGAVVVPNETTVGYSLAAGGVSAPIFPPANIPVHVMGVQTAVGFRGVGQVTLLHVPSSFIEWVGLESTSGAAITQGFSGAAGTHIVFIDFSHQVQIEVASPDSIRVHNFSSGIRTGVVTLNW